MLSSLAWTALIMGLAGGSHCLVMCAAPCSAVVSGGGGGVQEAEQPVHWANRAVPWRRLSAYHAGRILGYSLVGALAAVAMQSLAWLTQQASALRPVWTFFHVAVLAWGVLLLLQARQPVWVERAGRSVWRRVQPLVQSHTGVFMAGMLWSLMPCGLLYSALLVAALTGGALQGALAMAFFALGSGLWLLLAPWLWLQVRVRVNAWRTDWGTRLAGLLLSGVAVWALWHDLIYRPSLICD